MKFVREFPAFWVLQIHDTEQALQESALWLAVVDASGRDALQVFTVPAIKPPLVVQRTSPTIFVLIHPAHFVKINFREFSQHNFQLQFSAPVEKQNKAVQMFIPIPDKPCECPIRFVVVDEDSSDVRHHL
jgi:hypothetical protein